jgi:hypothetical protein
LKRRGEPASPFCFFGEHSGVSDQHSAKPFFAAKDAKEKQENISQKRGSLDTKIRLVQDHFTAEQAGSAKELWIGNMLGSTRRWYRMGFCVLANAFQFSFATFAFLCGENNFD